MEENGLTMELRPYQCNSITSIYDYFENNSGNPLIVLPTGTGKSIVIAEFIRGAITQYPNTRLCVAVHTRELVQQNYLEFSQLAPHISCGVYSAGLKRRDLGHPVMFCGIQSIYRRAIDLQWVDILIADECHLIPRSANTMWGKFIGDLRSVNPAMKVIGFTATGFRLDSGSLTYGNDAIFDQIIYEYSILDAMKDGYLSEVVPRHMATNLDVTGVHKRGGEFIAGELERAIDIDSVTKAAVSEIVQYGSDRKLWLVFAAGVSHAKHICEAVREHGISCGVVTAETALGERDALINAFKSQSVRCLVNVQALTTGFNVPGVDLIAALRPTGSAGLWVQMLGRGTRLAPDKRNCLVLDFAGNTERHGPLDMIKGRDKDKSNDGVPPTKICPDCLRINYAGIRQCACGHEFPVVNIDDKLNKVASNASLLSTQRQPIEWLAVDSVQYKEHLANGKLIPTLRVDYQCGVQRHSEWVTLEHSGTSRERACAWWRDRGGTVVPRTVEEASEIAPTILTKPSEIAVQKDGKWMRVVGHR